MSNDNFYDIAIIGGGISSCVFASIHIKNGFNGKIAIIENGRNLGGRSSTRISRSNKGWKLNHGSPNFNICNDTNDKLLKKFIQELLDAKIIQTDNSEVIKLNGESKTFFDFFRGTSYISRSSMSELSQNIITSHDLRNQVEYFFETFILKLDYGNNEWILTSKNGSKFKTKFLVCSSNLILHKRSLDIMKINQIPFRKAVPLDKDKKIDKLINLINEQDYIQRLTCLIYTKTDYSYKDNYKNKFRYFLLNNTLEEKFKFERIVFQKQDNNKLGIVIHTKNKKFINEYHHSKNNEIFKEKLLLNFNLLFDNDKYINKLVEYQDISIMKWRASQPNGLRIPENLQICENLNVGFCGDWFDFQGFGRVEGAILSALKLSYKINLIY